MSTATGRGRLFFQAVGPSELAQMPELAQMQNPNIESRLTKNLGLSSS